MKLTNPQLIAETKMVAVKCWACKKAKAVDVHHIQSKGHGGGYTLEVWFLLMLVCRECHDNFQRYREGFKREDALRVMADRYGTKEQAIEGAIAWLNQADQRWLWQLELLDEKLQAIKDSEVRLLVSVALDEHIQAHPELRNDTQS